MCLGAFIAQLWEAACAAHALGVVLPPPHARSFTGGRNCTSEQLAHTLAHVLLWASSKTRFRPRSGETLRCVLAFGVIQSDASAGNLSRKLSWGASCTCSARRAAQGATRRIVGSLPTGVPQSASVLARGNQPADSSAFRFRCCPRGGATRPTTPGSQGQHVQLGCVCPGSCGSGGRRSQAADGAREAVGEGSGQLACAAPRAHASDCCPQ